jgi:predicted transcriptional regulator
MTQPAQLAHDQETEAERKDRLAWEAEGIAEARAELDAGFHVDIADVRAWVDSLRTDTPLPLPPIRRS